MAPDALIGQLAAALQPLARLAHAADYHPDVVVTRSTFDPASVITLTDVLAAAEAVAAADASAAGDAASELGKPA